MNPTAALPFELPSMPASSPGDTAAHAFPKDFCGDDSGNAATFDEALSARSAVTPSPGLKLVGPRDLVTAKTSGDSAKPSLIVPADFQNHQPMPASLVPEVPVEVVEADDGGTEPAVESSEEKVSAEAAYEWVCALNAFRPVPDSESAPIIIGVAERTEPVSIGDASPRNTPEKRVDRREPVELTKPSTEAEPPTQPIVVSRELVVSGHRVDASAFGEFPTIKGERSGRLPDAKPGVVGRPKGADSTVVETPLDPVSPQAPPTPVHRAMPTGRVEVHQPLSAEELVKAVANRIKAGGNQPLEEAPPVAMASVPAQSQPKETVVPEWIKPVENRLKVVDIPTRGAFAVDASSVQPQDTAQEPVVPEWIKPVENRLKVVEIPVRIASPVEAAEIAAKVRSHQADMPVKAQELIQAIENRLKEEGIPVTGPIRVEVIRPPTATEPGRVLVEADKRQFEISGWSDQSGRIVQEQGGQSSFRSGAETDGKNQPGTSAPVPTLLPTSGRTTGAAIIVPTPDSSAKQAVTITTSQPVSARVPSVQTGGISSARQAIAMRSTNDQEEFAGNTTSRGSSVFGRNADSVSRTRPTDLLTELAAMPFSERASRTETLVTNPVAPLDRIVQSDRIDKLDAVERMRSVINHELAVLKATGADALAVVIRPTADTEVFVQLTREKGGVEAFIRVEKGDLGELRRHWSQLEGSLAEQQVRLQPLQSGSPMNQDSDTPSRQNRFAQEQDNGQAGAKFNFDGQSRSGFRQDDPRRPQSPFDTESFSPRNPNPSIPRSAPRRGTSTDRNFDNWA